jgi:hypothetical protein
MLVIELVRLGFIIGIDEGVLRVGGKKRNKGLYAFFI